jgi:hypothetical protein
MKNILSITHQADGRYKTEMSLIDGVKVMEMHRKGLHDSKILRHLKERNYYQHLPGKWCIQFVNDPHTINHDTLEGAIDKAQDYIFNRDNSDIEYEGIC